MSNEIDVKLKNQVALKETPQSKESKYRRIHDLVQSESLRFPFWFTVDTVLGIVVILLFCIAFPIWILALNDLGTTGAVLSSLFIVQGIVVAVIDYKRRYGYELVAHSEGLTLLHRDSVVTEIAWNDALGVTTLTRSLDGATYYLISRSGARIKLTGKYLSSGSRILLKDLRTYAIWRTAWLNDMRALLPKPRDKEVLRPRLILSGSISLLLFLVVTMPISRLMALLPATSWIAITMVVIFVLLWGILLHRFAIIYFEYSLWENPHAWDIEASPPKEFEDELQAIKDALS